MSTALSENRRDVADSFVSDESPFQVAPMQSSGEILLLGASFTTQNMGLWALTSSAVAIARQSWPTGTIRLLDYSREPATYSVNHAGESVNVELVNIRFSKRCLLKNNIARLIFTALLLRAVASPKVRQRIIGANPYLNAISRANIIGSIAGGDSFSDIYGFGRLLYVALPQILVLLMGKQLILLPQTIGPFRGRSARLIARYILRRAHTVYTRDDESLLQIESLVDADSHRIQRSYDMAFALEPIAPNEQKLTNLRKLEAHRPLIGLNISGLLMMGGYSRDNMFNLKSDYRELIREIIRYFVGKGENVLLIPHVFGNQSENQESDSDASAEIYSEMAGECGGSLHLLECEFDHQEIKYIIGRCDFFLGSRMHACIAALSQFIPAIGLAYSQKFPGVFRTIDANDLVLNLCVDSKEEIIRRIVRVFAERERIATSLRDRMPAVKHAILALLRDAQLYAAYG